MLGPLVSSPQSRGVTLIHVLWTVIVDAMQTVLKWGNEPRDLDMYVIPVNVVDENRKSVKWTMPMGQVFDHEYLINARARSCSFFRATPLRACSESGLHTELLCENMMGRGCTGLHDRPRGPGSLCVLGPV